MQPDATLALLLEDRLEGGLLAIHFPAHECSAVGGQRLGEAGKPGWRRGAMPLAAVQKWQQERRGDRANDQDVEGEGRHQRGAQVAARSAGRAVRHRTSSSEAETISSPSARCEDVSVTE